MSRTTSRQPRTSTTPEPIRQPDPSPESASPTREGRDANGHFAKGNRFGPGNPFARQVAALRKALVEKVTPEDMEAIATSLILRARGGNLPAIKLLFSYIIGTPTPAVNPDTLDREEMEQYRQEVGMEELVCRVGKALTPEIACTMVRAVRPVNMERICNALADQLLEGVPPGHLPPSGDGEEDTEPDAVPPSANRRNGAAEDVEDEPGAGPIAEGASEVEEPSTNRVNRGGEPVAAAAPAPSGPSSQRHPETGRANPAAVGPRAPWPGGRRQPRPVAGSRERRPASREQGPARAGGQSPA
jgi:hypothetical protein